MFGKRKSWFVEVTSPDGILAALRHHMRTKQFVPGIWQKPGTKWGEWTVTPGGHHLQGFSVLGLAVSSEDVKDTVVTLTSPDVDYNRPIGSLRLGDISKVELLETIPST